jgi:hypothetical protein
MLMMCGGAQAAAPEFDIEHFARTSREATQTAAWVTWPRRCAWLSEQSTKTIVDKAWDRVSVTNRDMCVKTAGTSYVYLAKCLGSVQGR